MKHGVHIPPETRDAFAKAASEIAEGKPRSTAISEVAERFGVSDPTARNLISRGRFLNSQERAQ